VHVAPATFATRSHDESLVGVDDVGQELVVFLIEDLAAERNWEFQISTSSSVALLAGSVASGFRLDVPTPGIGCEVSR
jgi:hypothetical protein